MRKWHISDDPNYDREKQRYSSPIPSREYIIEFLREQGQPVRRGDIIKAFNLTTEEEKEALRRRLRAMERDGELIFTRRGGYGLVEKMNLVRGRVMGHRDGYGFVISDDGSDDLYLSSQQMRQVFDGDRVLARIAFVNRRGRREGEIVEILERNTEKLVGRFFSSRSINYVVPENKRITQDIIIPSEYKNGAKEGQYVIVEITAFPTVRTQPVGRITEVIGDHMAPGMEIDVAIRSYALPHSWSDEILMEVTKFSPEVAEQDKQNRVNLCEKAFVTIDGEDAKDFDDAVYCEPGLRGGWILYVAIADVSHYVRLESPLDAEALNRGNSVYFPGRVIPMLPEVLSNNLCSLKPKVDRLALVCQMSITKAGKLSNYRFYEAVIHSKARMTYTNVAKILIDKDQKLCTQYQALLPYLENLYALYKVLHKRRSERGALEFNTTETKVIFGKDRKIEKIIPLVRNDAHRLIEECMLLANVSAAQLLLEEGIPALFRVHDGPSEDRITELRTFLSELGLQLGGGTKPTPKDFSKLLSQIGDRPDAHLIQTVLLRSMCQAVYTPENIGHFGLAYEGYTHFTSPIRRYPDLLVHRAIRHHLRNRAVESFAYDSEKLADLGSHCSFTERRADEATRDVMDWLKCEYMRDRIGETFDGIITGVTGFGLFVELTDIYVEGLIHVTALHNDYYHFDPTRYRLVGEKTKIRYRLGDRLRVRVVRVGLDERQIDFALANDDE